MMFEITVKILDGRAKSFSLPDEITVRQFKEKIESSMEIPVDQQRLIFLGRALLDNDLLKSSGCDGKVVHLVPRPPPGQDTSAGASSGSGAGQPQDDDAMDADMAAGGQPLDPNQFQEMIRGILEGMGDMGRNAAVQTLADGNGVDIHVNIPHTGHRQSLARLRRSYLQRVENQARGLLQYLQNPDANALPSADWRALHLRSPYLDHGTGANASAPADGAQGSDEDPSRPLPVASLADMLDSVLTLLRDAEPQLNRWRTILRSDEEQMQLPEQQQHFDSIQRFLHMLAHMLHNVSDFIVELSQPPPRHLLVLSEVPMQTVVARINIDTSPGTDGAGRAARRHATTTTEERTQPRSHSAERPPTSAAADNGVSTDAAGIRPRASSTTRQPPRSFATAMRRVHREGNTVTTATFQSAENGQVYRSASIRPPTALELRPDSIAFNTVSAHVITAGGHGQNSGNGGIAADTTASEASPTVGGLPADVMRQVLENAIRQSLASTLQAGPAGGAARSGPVSGGPGGLPASTNGEAHPGMNVGGLPAGMNTVDPFLYCTSRHYMDMSSGRIPGQPFANMHMHTTMSRGAGMGTGRAGARPPAPPPPPPPPSSSQAAAGGPSPAGLFENLLSSFRAAAGGSGSAQPTGIEPTVLDVFRNSGLVDATEMSGNLINDVLLIAMGRLSPSQVMRVLLGNESEALDCLRTDIQNYLRDELLRSNGSEEQIRTPQQAVDYLLQEWCPVLRGAVAGLEVQRSGVQVVPSIDNCLRANLSRVIRDIQVAEQDAGFGALLRGHTIRAVNEVGALVLLLLGQPGLTSFCERLVRQWTSTQQTGSSGVSTPLVNDLVVQAARSRLAGWQPVGQVEMYIVMRSSESESVEQVEQDVQKYVTQKEDVPSSWQEDTTEEEQMAVEQVLAAHPVAERRLQERAELRQLNEPWHSVLPDTWLPVVRRDELFLRQQQMNQPPASPSTNSDAYMSGQPAKRRKIVMSERSERSLQSVESVLVETLRDAAHEVQGISSELVDRLCSTSGTSTGLVREFRRLAADRVHRRITSNPDFSAERFPRAQEAFGNREDAR